MQTFISVTAVSAMSIMLAITNPPPDSIELTGTVRDFKERTESDGHPDFEVTPSKGLVNTAKTFQHNLEQIKNRFLLAMARKLNTKRRIAIGVQ